MVRKNTKYSKAQKNSFYLGILYVMLIVGIIANFVLMIINSEAKATEFQPVKTTKVQKTSYWKEIIINHNDYLPAWLRLIEDEINNNNKIQARKLIQAAKTIDPNSEELLLLEKLAK